jgi:hypothetical protein
VNPDKEGHFLETAINDLQRVAKYGGEYMRVGELIRRYQFRLNAVRHFEELISPAVPPAPVVAQAPVTPIAAKPSVPEMFEEAKEAPAPGTSPLLQEGELVVAAAPPQRPQSNGRVFSWRSFFADQAINIVASVGAFLLLIGSLSFTITTKSLLISFLVVFVVHAIFGFTGFVTYRFPSFRIVATIYTIIFALLIPLVSFSAYRLLSGSQIEFSTPVLIAISATYAAIMYMLMAIYQRFIPFAYLGMVALLVADLSVADALNLAWWWWPSMALLLAILSTISLKSTAGSAWPFMDRWAVLRDPMRYVMFAIIAACLLGLFYTVSYSLNIDASGSPNRELRFSILSMSALLLLWTALSLWLAKWMRAVLALAYLAVGTVLAFCYALDFEPIGYALALTGVAFFYHGINRFEGRRLLPFGQLSLGLDQIALVLVLIVPLISSPLLPLQLFAAANIPSIDSASFLHVQTSWRTVAELIAVGLGIVITVSVMSYRAGLGKTPARAGWCWLLLPGGFLLTWEFSIVVVASGIEPVWAFLGLALVILVGTVVVRRLYGAAWANPLDVLALFEMTLTLSLSLNQNPDIISALLLSTAALLYFVLLYQQRPNWLFLPLIYAILALPTLWSRPFTMLLLGVVLPLASAAIHQFVSSKRNTPRTSVQADLDLIHLWEWPLLAAGLVYGTAATIHNVTFGISALQNMSGVNVPIAAEIALLSVSWYASSALARKKLWLVPSVAFAIGALLIPNNSFWVLLGLTPVLAILGMAISRFADRDWALPLYITAVFSAIMTGYTGFAQDHLIATSWALLGFAAIALVIMLVERIPELLVFPAGLAAWALWLWATPPLDFTSLMIAYCLLCLLIFSTQFLWRIIPSAEFWLPDAMPSVILGLGGQILVVMFIIGQGGFSPDSGHLVHVGAGSLLELAILLFWYGSLYKGIVAREHRSTGDELRFKSLENAEALQHWCYYIAGLLLSLVISWELSAFGQTRLDILLLAPASYLSIIAAFIMRDETLQGRHWIGQIVALSGAVLLLLPSLWFSFSESNLTPTLVLIGESLALLLLGLATRLRIFILSCASLLIVGTLRALFLSTPPSLALMVLGVMLVVIATALFLVRYKLKVAWTQWE